MKKISTNGGLVQFIKFGLVGAFNTVLSYVVYSFCYYVLHTNAYVANIFQFVISVFSAYLLQTRFVFKESEDGEKRVWWKVLIKTYIAYAFTGLFLTEILLLFWLNIINLGQYLGNLSEWIAGFGISIDQYDLAVSAAPILNMFITIPLNFIINKFWAYRQKDTKKSDDKKEPES